MEGKLQKIRLGVSFRMQHEDHHKDILNCYALHCTALYCTVTHRIAFQCGVLIVLQCYIISYHNVLHCTAVYDAVISTQSSMA
jgi:hypothetical protein